jgi:hypothetical protein
MLIDVQLACARTEATDRADRRRSGAGGIGRLLT